MRQSVMQQDTQKMKKSMQRMSGVACLFACLLACLLACLAIGLASGAAQAQTPAPNAPVPNAAPAADSAKAHDNSYVIGNDDVLSVNVWKEPDISQRSLPVRSDGRISLPLVGEVQAAGQTPLKLEKDIAAKLQSFISEPEVSVMVEQSNSQKFNILGQILKPGSYAIANSPTVLDAIALAGGFRDFAKQKSIYILRQGADGQDARLPFNYKDVIKGKNLEQNVKILPRDTIVVP
jgi:polysaccharide biosynthesis/export protein